MEHIKPQQFDDLIDGIIVPAVPTASMLQNKVKNEKHDSVQTETVEVFSTTCWYLSGKVSQMKADFLIDSGSTYTIWM